jgi:hypothetical protein
LARPGAAWRSGAGSTAGRLMLSQVSGWCQSSMVSPKWRTRRASQAATSGDSKSLPLGAEKPIAGTPQKLASRAIAMVPE